MKSLLAITGALLLLGFTAQAGPTHRARYAQPVCYQPVVAHVVHCHTTQCGSPCGHAHYSCGSCRQGHSYAPAAHIHVANPAYCNPRVKVKIRRHCLPRVVYYRACYTRACAW